MLDETMTHATVPLAESTVHSKHPFKNKQNHDKLLEYLQSRLRAGAKVRDQEIPRMVRVDKNFAGWMKLDDQDKKRQKKKDETGDPQAIKMNLPLGFVHIDDMMTYFAQTFAPNRGMFYHTGSPDEVAEAGQIVTLMNNHAIYSGYYRQVLRGILSLLKYNKGGYSVNWARESGPKIVREEGSNVDTVISQIRWQGNKMEALDMYNFLYDPLVSLTDLHKDGEFAATVRVKSHYWLQNKASTGTYFNCKEALERNHQTATLTYYKSPPSEAQLTSSDSGGGTDWVSVLAGIDEYAVTAGYELAEIYIRLNPTEFGLIEPKLAKDRNRYEIWRFTVLNNEWIIDATQMNNIHGWLPFMLGFLNDDIMESAQRSVSEIIQPLQDFASFLMNIHVMGSRSAVWGVEFYDPTIIPYDQVPAGEVSARIPIKSTGYGKNVSEAIWQHNASLETKQTLQDLSALMDIVNQFFPTQALPSQIASIDRAVTDQVAAVQQGANRRQQKAARLLDDGLFRNVRFVMYYNIIQYQPDAQEVTDYYTGKPVKIDLASLRNTDLPFIIGQGLKSLDRAAAAQAMQNVIFALIQSPQASQGIDILALIDYWTSMLDIDIDMKQFRIQQAPAQPGAEGGAVAGAGGNPIQPATNPEAVTAPIYG